MVSDVQQGLSLTVTMVKHCPNLFVPRWWKHVETEVLIVLMLILSFCQHAFKLHVHKLDVS